MWDGTDLSILYIDMTNLINIDKFIDTFAEQDKLRVRDSCLVVKWYLLVIIIIYCCKIRHKYLLFVIMPFMLEKEPLTWFTKNITIIL